uniref:Uncharacterized protein n=1 Tax=Arion vulgaris TaxID=1028688 RepID=A0A0B7BCC5_9EUPU
MIQHNKQRCKAMQQEEDSVYSEEGSIFMNQPRSVLTALDERINDLERGNRSRRKRKVLPRQNTCTSQRPTSLPMKNVSFSPHTIHSLENENTGEGQHPTIRNKCAWCDGRSRRSTLASSPCRKKLPMKNLTDQLHNDDSCMSANSIYDSPENYTGVCSSPGRAKFRSDFSTAGYKQPRTTGGRTTTSCSEERNKSGLSNYYNNRFARICPYFNPLGTLGRHGMASTHTSHQKMNDIFKFRNRPSFSCSPIGDIWEPDSNVDLLLAKYKYPQILSPPTNYVRYKSSFLSQGMHVRNISNNRSVRISVLPVNVKIPRVHTRSTSSSLSSRYDALINNYVDRAEPFYYNYDKSRNCAYNNVSEYQPQSTKAIVNDQIFAKKFKLNKSFNPLASTFSNTISDSHNIGRNDNWIQPLPERKPIVLRSKYFCSLPHTSIRLASTRFKDEDFAEDTKNMGRFCTFPRRTSQSKPEVSKLNRGYINHSFLSDSPFLSAVGKHNYKDELVSKKHSPYTIKENKSDFKYNWMSDIPSTHKYSTVENIKWPSRNKFNTVSYSFPISSFKSGLSKDNTNNSQRARYPEIKESVNPYFTKSDNFNFNQIIDNFCSPRRLDSESLEQLLKIIEPISRATLHPFSESGNETQATRSESTSAKVAHNNNTSITQSSMEDYNSIQMSKP